MILEQQEKIKILQQEKMEMEDKLETKIEKANE